MSKQLFAMVFFSGLVLAASFLPVHYAAAATVNEITTLDGLLRHVNAVLNVLVPFLVGLGVFVIMYGIFGYLSHAAEEEKRAEAKLFIVWGVIGIFIMVSIWGFVNILLNTFNFKRTGPEVLPSMFPGAN